MRLAQPYLVASQCDTINLTGKIVITSEKNIIKISDYLTNIPVNTHDTTAQVHGVTQVHYHNGYRFLTGRQSCTRTRDIH